MRKKLIEELKSVAPNFYSDLKYFEVGNGWFGIIKQASIEIEKVILSMPEDQRHGARCGQIKEKFGGLRIHPHGHFPAIERIIDIAEECAGQTCENCGAPGKERDGGWIKTLCDNCPKVAWNADD